MVKKEIVNNVFIRKSEIDSYVQKKDVLILRMKSGKTWVCDKQTNLNQNDEFIPIILAQKDKSE